MMKKNLLILAVAAAALASCSSDEVVSKNTSLTGNDIQQKEISISPLAKPSTRSSETTTAIDGATYPNNLIMQVAAYAFPNPASTWSAGAYFGKTPFDGTGSIWTGDPKRYWPLTDAYVSFLAVAGVETADITFGDPSGSAASVTYDAASSTGKFDLIYSGKQEHVAQSGNSLTYPDDVDMVFKHALSWLQFNVKAASSDYASRIKVSQIVINDATQTGSFAITNTGYNTVGDPTPTGVWTPDAAAAYTVNDNATVTLTNANQSLGTALLVPNPAGNSFTSFTIYYTIDDVAFTFNYTPASLTLAQATKYIYDITFTLTEIIIDPEVQDWTNGATTNVDIPTLAIGTSATYSQPADGGTYTLKITGLTGSGAPTIDASGSSTAFTSAPIATAPSTGITTVTYDIPANAAAGASRTFSFTVTDNGGSGGSNSVSTITINQAAGPDYVAP